MITPPINISYANLSMADIELIRVFKGLHQQADLKHNPLTKLFSLSSGHTVGCDRQRTLETLQVGHSYVHFGNFNEGRLFLTGCDFLLLVTHLRRTDRQLLNEGIIC